MNKLKIFYFEPFRWTLNIKRGQFSFRILKVYIFTTSNVPFILRNFPSLEYLYQRLYLIKTIHTQEIISKYVLK